MNGAILGMRKQEIQRRFDEIVEFSGVERYIDTPVKRYSSGMYVRLAFAVAAHLESEILIVDEVLAVGDAEFQRKCLGKMGDFSKSDGRTVLFVSHNLDSVRMLCNKGIVLNKGSILFNGNADDAISSYVKSAKSRGLGSGIANLVLSPDVTLSSFQVDKPTIVSHEDLDFQLVFHNRELNHYTSLVIYILDKFDQKLAFIDLRSKELNEKSDRSTDFSIKGTLKNLPLLPGQYFLGIHIQSNLLYNDFDNLIQFDVTQKPLLNEILPYPLHIRGTMEIDVDFDVINSLPSYTPYSNG